MARKRKSKTRLSRRPSRKRSSRRANRSHRRDSCCMINLI